MDVLVDLKSFLEESSRLGSLNFTLGKLWSTKASNMWSWAGLINGEWGLILRIESWCACKRR